MTNPNRTHPIWGRAINDYTASYDMTAAQKRKAITRKQELEAVEAIQKVSRLATQARSDIHHGDAITMDILELILQLTLSPRTFHRFGHPPLVSGCVKLLSSVNPDGRPSPFSYEFGYLCYKILTIAVGVCILQRSNTLDIMISRMSLDLDTELLLIFSDSVVQAVNPKIQIGIAGGPCDWVIDWVEGVGSQPGALVSQSNIRDILSLLWDDRELLVKALAATYTPGPSGILFLLWRHLHFEGVFNTQPPSKIAAPFCEILWRYTLVFTRDQGDTLLLLQNHLQNCGATDVWNFSPKAVALSDLKNLIQVYYNRLPMSNIELLPALNIGILPIMLNFLCHLAGAQSGAEGYYPLLVERTLERVCDTLTLETERDDFEARFRHAQAIFSFLAVLFGHTETAQTYSKRDGQRAVMGILKALKRLGILDLVGKMFLMLSPASDGQMDYQFMSAFLAQAMLTTVQKVAIIAPRDVICATFKHYVPNWIRFHNHLLFLINAAPASPGPQVAHLELCCRVWRDIAKSLGIYDQIGLALSNPLFCRYARCMNPTARNGALDALICDGCTRVLYCSSQCQSKDWENDRGIESHREACKLFIE